MYIYQEDLHSSRISQQEKWCNFVVVNYRGSLSRAPPSFVVQYARINLEMNDKASAFASHSEAIAMIVKRTPAHVDDRLFHQHSFQPWCAKGANNELYM